MATFDGSGALGMLGEDPVPRGTPDELRAAGLDPEKVGSCAPRSPGVRGCPMEGQCIFGQARYGGFKGKGPRYIGYSLITIEGPGKRDTMTCHGFVRSLVHRMRAGEMAREEGKAHESIRIIAHEGDEIEINPIVQVDPNDKKPNAELKRKPQKIQVPRHMRPGENPQVTYDQQLWAEEQVRRKYDADLSGMAPTLNEPDQPYTPDDDALDMGATPFPAEQAGAVVAEPVSKGVKK